MKIITNNQPRYTLDSFELTKDERKEFDYLDWEAIDKGDASAALFRYKGNLYDLGEFSLVESDNKEMKGWHGYSASSYFSGIVVKYDYNQDSIIVGRYYS